MRFKSLSIRTITPHTISPIITARIHLLDPILTFFSFFAVTITLNPTLTLTLTLTHST
eukprot:GABW01003536.1.p2 GENE.GABW01003536.1~~GABW01003536.1.p2  ORF type:complete len:58 (-),score=8.75 GABW01003536.1:3-176(-)